MTTSTPTAPTPVVPAPTAAPTATGGARRRPGVARPSAGTAARTALGRADVSGRRTRALPGEPGGSTVTHAAQAAEGVRGWLLVAAVMVAVGIFGLLALSRFAAA